MTNQLNKRLKIELAQRHETNLLRKIKICPSFQVNLSGNDYLQLRYHPRVLKYAQITMEKYGSGSGASPLLSGYLPCHERLLEQLLLWKKKTAGLLFNSGFMANQAVLRHLPGPKDIVLADKLVHHSIIQSLTYSKVKFKRYKHLDLNRLEELLNKYQKNYETLFVVTESVFSMDGEYPDLHQLASLKTKFSFIWILDEAHGTGVFGPSGGGLAEEAKVLPQVDIFIGTLGKALASMGA